MGEGNKGLTGEVAVAQSWEAATGAARARGLPIEGSHPSGAGTWGCKFKN